MKPQELLCPSAPATLPGAVVIGIATGAGPATRIRPTAEAVPITAAILRMADPLQPAELFRSAAPCQATGCANFADGACQLAARVVRGLEPEEPGWCPVRRSCRWFLQEGIAVCTRCTQILTEQTEPPPHMAALVSDEP